MSCEHEWQDRKCTLCGEEMDSNEDDRCGHCLTPTGGRILYCSKECSDQHEMEMQHTAGVEATLATLSDGDSLQIDKESLKDLLVEVFHLRWQNRLLQARNTKLVMEKRDLLRLV